MQLDGIPDTAMMDEFAAVQMGEGATLTDPAKLRLKKRLQTET